MAKEKEVFAVEYEYHLKGNNTTICSMFSLYRKKADAVAFAVSINSGKEDECSAYHCYDAKVVPKTLH